MSKQEKALTKDRLIGMQVIDSEGNNAGAIKDIAFTVGKMGMTLIVHTEGGQEVEVPWEQIQAAGDYVLLKPMSGQTHLRTTTNESAATSSISATSLSNLQRAIILYPAISAMVLLQRTKVRLERS